MQKWTTTRNRLQYSEITISPGGPTKIYFKAMESDAKFRVNRPTESLVSHLCRFGE